MQGEVALEELCHQNERLVLVTNSNYSPAH